MSSRFHLCLVYSDDDAEQWARYVVHHLGSDHFRFRLLPVTDRKLLDWLTTANDAGAASTRLREASDARTFIVVVSPALVRLMVEQPMLDFHRLVEKPSAAQVFVFSLA